jgi:putative GTP pyrophosphokinase
MANFDDTFDWKIFMVPYRQAVEELDLKFNVIIRQCYETGEYAPIHHVYSRVKTLNSIMEKVATLGIEQEQIPLRITDIAGVRIITQFEEDIYQVVRLIKSRSDMAVVTIKDYVASPKASGYKSVHLIIEYAVNTVNGPQTVLCEIQIRTLAMDFWASIEHSLNYKYKDAMPENVKKRLVEAALRVHSVDDEMGKIRDEYKRSSKAFQTKIVYGECYY